MDGLVVQHELRTKSSRATWSTGCYTCRRRKVKCDEAKPECLKCLRGGRVCSGYRKTQELVFRSMNSSVAAKAHTAPPVERTFAHSYATNTASEHGSSMLHVQPPTMLYVQPPTDWDEYAVARFISHYVEPASDHDPGYMDFLTHMLNWPDSSSRESFLAVSLASFGNVSGMKELQVRSKVHYGRALRALQAALNDAATAVHDSTLLSVVILQTYEIMAGTIAPPDADPHEVAMTELLRLRSSKPKFSNASKKLDSLVEARKEIQGVFVSLNGKEERNDSSTTAGASFRTQLRNVSAACNNLRVAMSQASYQADFDQPALLCALEHANEVYSDLVFWPKTTPVNWRYKPRNAPKDVQAYGVSNLFLFGSFHHAAIWQVYFCCRVQMCESILQAYTFLKEQSHPNPPPAPSGLSEEDVRAAMIAAVDDVCSCAPYLLSDVDEEGHMKRNSVDSKTLGAFFYLRGLMVTNGIENLPRRQRRLLLHLFGRLGAQFGIRVAWRMRDDWVADHGTEAEEL